MTGTTRLGRAVPGVLLACALGLGTAGCGSNVIEAQDSPALADLAARRGEQVTVTAEVAGLESPSAFTIVDREGSGEEPLLVVHAADEPVDEEGTVTVTGTVGVFDAQRDLVGEQDPARLTQYDGKPYIDASRVTPSTG